MKNKIIFKNWELFSINGEIYKIFKRNHLEDNYTSYIRRKEALEECKRYLIESNSKIKIKYQEILNLGSLEKIDIITEEQQKQILEKKIIKKFKIFEDLEETND